MIPRWLFPVLLLWNAPLWAQSPWPAQMPPAQVNLQPAAADPGQPGVFAWNSGRFVIRSDVKLPNGVVRDFALVFEATRQALAAVPLGLEQPGRNRPLPVLLCGSTESYRAGGGTVGSGGFFNGREMLILLPNLGIQPTVNALTAQHHKQLFVVRHEVSHQILSDWGWHTLPAWLNEGLPECVASWPYTSGRYSFQNFDSALRAYVTKWRKSSDRTPMRILAPSRLMGISRETWRAEVVAQGAYDHYNSAALLTHYFLRHDGKGDAAALAAYFADLRAGTPDAEAKHLLRGRTPQQLNTEIKALAKRLALEIALEE